MSRFGRKMLPFALLLPVAAPAFAGEAAAPRTGLAQKAWKPRWLPMKAPSENTHLVNTQAQRLFSPMAAVRITNHLRDEGSEAKEILLAGHENNAASIKLYQESTDRYTRVDIPPELLRETFHNQYGAQLQQMGWQGVGTSGKHVVVAGGSSVSHNNGYMPTAKVFMVDAQTKKVKALPDLKTARALPMVGASPSGRLVIVAGGVVNDGRQPQASKAIDVIDRVTGQHVDLATKFTGLAEGLPEGRFAGNIAWVQEPGVDRIFFIGGSSSYTQNGTPLGQQPTKTIHFYDVKEQKWGAMELPTPRMGAGVAIRHLGDGRQEIVVAGGGTGVNASQPIDPQIYAVERIDPRSLTVKFGENVPEQQGLFTAQGERHSAAMEWAPNALVLTHAGRSKADRMTIGARFFGFSNAFKTDPVPEEHRAGPSTVVNVHNTTINETSIRETNVRNDVRINETDIVQQQQHIQVR